MRVAVAGVFDRSVVSALGGCLLFLGVFLASYQWNDDTHSLYSIFDLSQPFLNIIIMSRKEDGMIVDHLQC